MKLSHPMLTLAALGGLCCTVGNLASAQTWTQTSAPSNYWYALASSADGRTLVAAIGGGGGQNGPVFVSTNSGVSWSTAEGASTTYRASVASSADGTKLWAATWDPIHNSGAVYLSTNSGANWNSAGGGGGVGIASSADGTKLALVNPGGSLS